MSFVLVSHHHSVKVSPLLWSIDATRPQDAGPKQASTFTRFKPALNKLYACICFLKCEDMYWVNLCQSTIFLAKRVLGFLTDAIISPFPL